MTIAEATEDRLLAGRVIVFQPKTGFRAGTDSVLLSAALDAKPGTEVLEIGCGAGAALFCAAIRLPDARFVGVDRDAAMLNLAGRGIEANRLESRTSIERVDAGALPRDWENTYDQVFSNPPFFEPSRTSPPGDGKTAAYLSDIGLDAWIKAMLFAAKPRAPITLIHRAAELARILSVLEPRSGEITVLPVRPYPGSEAKRVLVRARKGLRPGPARLLAGLDLHAAKGAELTERAGRILAGDAFHWL